MCSAWAHPSGVLPCLTGSKCRGIAGTTHPIRKLTDTRNLASTEHDREEWWLYFQRTTLETIVNESHLAQFKCLWFHPYRVFPLYYSQWLHPLKEHWSHYSTHNMLAMAGLTVFVFRKHISHVNTVDSSAKWCSSVLVSSDHESCLTWIVNRGGLHVFYIHRGSLCLLYWQRKAS